MNGLALAFPGQGSQTVGMGAEMAGKFASAAAIFDRADALLGWKISKLCRSGPAEKLNLTEFAQPAMFVDSIAVLAVMKEKGIWGDVVLGHSMGEYSALAAAGAIGFEEGLKLVVKRGEIMARAAAEQPGSMAAILGLKDNQVEEICGRIEGVWPVNYNSPGQLVISGKTQAVSLAMAEAKKAGARKTVELPLSGSFHSPLMEGAAREMEKLLAGTGFKEPQPQFFSTISCRFEEAAGLAELLTSQIISPVRWRQSVEKLITEGVTTFFEVGNGKVLTGLIKRINRDVVAVNVSDPAGMENALALMANKPRA